MVKQSPEVRKFYDGRFGELNIAVDKEHGKMFCLTDVCRGLDLLKKEGLRIIKKSECAVKEFFVKRTKIVTGHEFVDADGFLSLIAECRKNKADSYRKWVLSLPVTWKVREDKKEKGDKATIQVETKPTQPSKEVQNDDDCYPTLEEFFDNYVPLDDFIPLLADVLKDYLFCAQLQCQEMPFPEEHFKKVCHRIEILNCFNITLIANKSKYPSHYNSRSYANKENNETKSPFLCK